MPVQKETRFAGWFEQYFRVKPWKIHGDRFARSGRPDWFIPLAGGVWIELKVDDGEVSDIQRKVMKDLRVGDCRVGVVRGKKCLNRWTWTAEDEFGNLDSAFAEFIRSKLLK